MTKHQRKIREGLKKRVATDLAKALMQLDFADWHGRDMKGLHKRIMAARATVSKIFTATGYQFGSEGQPCRVRRRT